MQGIVDRAVGLGLAHAVPASKGDPRVRFEAAGDRILMEVDPASSAVRSLLAGCYRRFADDSRRCIDPVLGTFRTQFSNNQVSNGVDLTGWTELSGPACSPNGQYLVGWGKYNGVSQCFVAAVPAPGAIALLGMAGLARGRRRRG